MIRHIILIAGARPNFMKIASLTHALQKTNIQFRLVHTGKHYDKVMSQTLFEQLNIPKPQINLAYGCGLHTEPIGLQWDYQPLAKMPLSKHLFGW